jgi:vacuolar iron transporter family protein
MMARTHHKEWHRSDRIGWLRAAVLGANDGIVSTASLVVGVAAASAAPANVLLTGVAGLVAGAMSMAAGEYVSVHSQADTEKADLTRERGELANDPAAEQRELAAIYVGRGLAPALAQQVALQLMAHDAIGAHARDELGISTTLAARPVQAALASAASFAVGAALPLAVVWLAPGRSLIVWVGARGWRGCRRQCGARHLLGRAGDGHHRRRGLAVRRSDLGGRRGTSLHHRTVPCRLS